MECLRGWRSWRGLWEQRENFISADYIDEHGLKTILWQNLWNPRDLRKRSSSGRMRVNLRKRGLADWPRRLDEDL